MRFNIKIDMTPAELREFLGWPDVQPLQEEMLAKIREQMMAGAEGFDAMNLMKPFISPNMQSVEAMQNAFWQAFTGATASRASDAPKKKR